MTPDPQLEPTRCGSQGLAAAKVVIAGEEVLRARFMIYLADAAFVPALMV